MTSRLQPHRLGHLFRAASDVAGQADLRQVLFTVVETAMQVTGARYGALGVIADDGSLEEFLHVGMDEETVAEIGSPPTGQSLLGTISKGATVRLDHIGDHPDSSGFPSHHPPMDSFLGVPLRTGDRIFGNLYLTEKDGGFSEEDQGTIEILAVIGGTAVMSHALHSQLQRSALISDRERIARDVHDAVIQDLFAVGLSLEGTSQRVDNVEARDAIRLAVGRLDECITSLRHFIFDLQRAEAEDRPLTTELSELIQELADSYGAQVDLTFSGVLGDVSETVGDAIMHVVKETTSNALRHSGAKNVQVVVSGHAMDFRISVKDRGTGFEMDQITPGMGIRNIRDRIFGLGGSVEIQSTLGSGTVVNIHLPRR
jgi:signal transduction histidine kinase